MKTLEELSSLGLRGKDLSNAMYQEMTGRLPPDPDLTPTQRREAMAQFFALIDSMSDAELAENPLAGRPLNSSILRDETPSDASAA